MVMSRSLRAAFRLCAGVLLLTGCADAPVADRARDLPTITMTTGGGFEGRSRQWTITPDGSWTWTEEFRGTGASPEPPRTGRLTEAQRGELAVLATEPALGFELSKDHAPCTVSDGSSERLEVGSLRYVASWCREDRPRIAHLRERILSFTTGP